jgi:hypothetical protein
LGDYFLIYLKKGVLKAERRKAERGKLKVLSNKYKDES